MVTSSFNQHVAESGKRQRSKKLPSKHKTFIFYMSATMDTSEETIDLKGQCLFDRGLFSDALELFSRGAELKPSCKAHAVRSLVCLAAAGHYADCLKTVNDWMVSDGPTFSFSKPDHTDGLIK
ncbi:tetratricopeptide repeat protein 16 isoform X1 [Solea senegalensis]|uniref:Tetratricopeptide repeat protein 16 isoform X1 n=1 Tax=Solea senegalensis TaxID=28829 RepID=A0AAV6QL40_SOLSE|nr:tetratricopeptide repeat protein 16 isoform X1 [Solea senegalensis]